VAILIGAGNGTFTGPANLALPASSGPQAIAVGRLNGDAYEDLAVANKLKNVLGVFFEMPPDTTITAGPPALTNETTETVAFSSSDTASTFQCKVDSGSFGPCETANSHSATFSSDGTHTFQVRAVYAGHIDPTPAIWSFTIDTVPPPTPTLTGSEPASPANENNPRIRGTASAGSTVTLYTTLDCSGPAAASGTAAEFESTGIRVSVADDTATEFYATATDQAGNTSPCATEPVIYDEVTPDPPPPTDPPPAGPPPGPVGPPPADPGAPIKVDVTGPSMTVTGTSVKLKPNGSLSLSVSCPASEPGGCLGSLSLETVIQVRAGKRKVKLGKSFFRIAGGKSATVKLRLSKKNRSLVKSLRKVKALVIIDARDQVGNAATSTKKLVLRAR
jgi:hypothetical protein